MSKRNAGDGLDKEDVLRAVLVADDFQERFQPFLTEGISVFLPLAQRKILDYSLEWLSNSGVQETLLFCSSHADSIKEYIRQSPWSGESNVMKVIVMLSESCMSLGDALRDIDNKGILKSDFILLSTSTISNLELQSLLKIHKAKCKEDRGTAMTMILKDRGHVSKELETVSGIDAETKRLLVYSKSSLESKLQLPMEIINEHVRIDLSTVLQDTGIAICSPSLPLLFSDNFDFQTKEDFIRGLLMNEEVLASRIYVEITEEYCQTVHDWPSYQRVSLEIMHRWSFPLVPDVPFGTDGALCHSRDFVYKHPSANVAKGCILESDVIIGRNCVLGNNSFIARSVIGAGCTVGDEVTIRDSFILENTEISEGCHLNLAVIGENVKVARKSTLRNCQLQHNVHIAAATSLQDKFITSQQTEDVCEKLGEAAFVVATNRSECDSEDGDNQPAVAWLTDPLAAPRHLDDSDSDSEPEDERSLSPEADDCALFYNEVVESLLRGYEEKLPCSNLILEVNSSRYAYNVTLAEVTQLTCKAVFSLPSRIKSPAKPILVFFRPLFANYVKNESGQLECLSAFEDTYEGLGNELVNCMHYLYDIDVIEEDSILSWHSDLEDTKLQSRLQKFIDWLEKDDESEESEED